MLLSLLLSLLVGCTTAEPPVPPRAWDADQAGRVLDRWSTAALHGDRAAFDAELSAVDPGFAPTAGRLFDNLEQLGWVRWTLGTDRRELRDGRRDVLGGGEVVVVAADVSWSASTPGGEGTPPVDTQQHRVWLTWSVQDGAPLIAGTVDGPAEPDRPSPLWWWEPVTVQQEGSLTILAGRDPAAWARRSSRAWAAARAADVEAARPVDLPVGRSAAALVQVPSSVVVRQRVLGTSTRSPTAALTLADPDGVHPVLVDPAAALGEEAWELVLTHELVHVLTASPGSGSPRWLVEGLAESVAREAYPGVATASEADAREALTTVDGQPGDGLPPDADLAAGSAGAYLRAWVAVRLLQERIGRDPVLAVVAGTAAGEDLEPQLRARDWSSSALAASVDETLEDLAEGRSVAALR